jgi:peroxiredoxin
MLKKAVVAILLITLFSVAIVKAVESKKEPENTSQEKANIKGIKIGSIAPDFELKTLNGEMVKLSNLKGKKVMVNFWATWCHPCKIEMPEMEEFHNGTAKDVVILAVNIDPYSDVKGFADKNNITFPILLDDEDKVNQLYQVMNIPTTYFIDSKGIIQNKYIGSMNTEIMKSFSNKLK